MKYILPLGIFLLIAGFLARGLVLNPSEIPSPFIDKPAPALQTGLLALPGSSDAGESVAFDGAALVGQVWVLNIFASWCAACVTEHPVISTLSEREDLVLVGLNYKDKPADAVAWLQQFGNPYDHVAQDEGGRIGIDWGVYGVPETFVIDAQGIVRYKHIGPVDETVLQQKILPVIDALNGSAMQRAAIQRCTGVVKNGACT